MENKRHRQIAQLFAKAIELQAEQREAFLTRECGSDSKLLEEVRSLLAHDQVDGTDELALTDAGKHVAAVIGGRLDLAAGRTVSHYKILMKIGEGGMGEVYKAEDIRLDRIVALKFLAPELTRDPNSKARFIREAKAVSALDHPNVCTVHEIDETPDGRLFIVMAYYEGQTLNDVIAHGPMEAEGAVAIARQVARGLAQAHERGIVHRDIKPANIMILADGIVKVVDFGIAKRAGQTGVTQAGSAVGTLAYMSPEQIQGGEVDYRTDIWSLGVALYEMVTGQLPFQAEERAALLYSILNLDPAALTERQLGVRPELDRVIGTCLKKSPTERYQSFQELEADLEALGTILAPAPNRAAADTPRALTARLTVHPYPGLASFTEADTAYFHGRESEVETIWHKLEQQKLLAVIGPSGTGKTSFLRAGLIPARPNDWRIIICTPGSSPFLSLRQALVPELAGSTEAIRELLSEDPLEATVAAVSRWRRSCKDALLILDQFEELFTLSPPEVQAQFTELLGRLVRESDIHIVLSLRDDFLFHCQAYPALTPVFDSITPLGPLVGADLCRALTQPAAKLGYGFEEDDLVDEMLGDVEGERGALPMLAFSMSRLWAKRDRERRLLTRKAYEAIGGVKGALALHAEATMDGISVGHQAIVRELFRSLVTAQGTRVARDRDELLSMFPSPEREAAGSVLQELIRARLLTSYELVREGQENAQRIEIIHESLLTRWPRLVRWQTQDADAALFRDQIRQAAGIWNDKGRPADLVWTGTLYKEFELWREQYPGALTDTESDYCQAIEHKARQKRRRRVSAATIGFAFLIGVLGVVTGLWQRSEVASQKAILETQRAEANLLASLGREIAATDPTTAVAYALASLEREDQDEVRRLALENLAKGPLRFEIPKSVPGNPLCVDISANGKYFAVGWSHQGSLWLYHVGSDSALEFCNQPPLYITQVMFDPRSERLISAYSDSTIRVWTVPGGKLLRTLSFTGETAAFWSPDDSRILTCTLELGQQALWKSWSLDSGDMRVLGRTGNQHDGGVSGYPDVSSDGRWISDYRENEVYLYSVENLERTKPRLIGIHEHPVTHAVFDSGGKQLASVDQEGLIKIWDLSIQPAPMIREFEGTQGVNMLKFDKEGRTVAVYWASGTTRVWDLEAPPRARPLQLTGQTHWVHEADFLDNGQWLISVGNGKSAAAWPLQASRPVILEDAKYFGRRIARFLPDGDKVVTCGIDDTVWLVSLAGGNSEPPRLLLSTAPHLVTSLAVDPAGRHVMVTAQFGSYAYLVSLKDGRIRKLEGTNECGYSGSFSPDGRLVGARWTTEVNEPMPIRIWEVETGERLDIDAEPAACYRLMPNQQLLICVDGRLENWHLDKGIREVVMNELDGTPRLISPSGRNLVYWKSGEIYVRDLHTGEHRFLLKPQDPRVTAFAVNKDESLLVLGCWGGDIYLVPIEGGDAHLFLGHEDIIMSLDFDPLGQYLGSMAGARDPTLRLWPLPKHPPVQNLDHADFLAHLQSQTNVRIVPDESQSTGFRVTLEPFPGWDALPNP
jgi:serine/threonine protein kinase/WD40 repeat protein